MYDNSSPKGNDHHSSGRANGQQRQDQAMDGTHRYSLFISCKHYGLFQLVIGCALKSSMLRKVTDECTDIMFFSLKLLS